VKADTTAVPNTLKTNVATIELIQGSGASALSDVAIQTAIGAGFTFLRIADITVPSGATSITDSNINNVVAKVKLSSAIDVEGGAIVYNNSSTSGDFISELASQDIPVLSPVAVNRTAEYVTDETLSGNSLGETVTTLTGGNTLPTGRSNTRSGIYTLFGYDWVFFLVNGVIHYSRKVQNSTASWSARVSTGIAVMDQNNRNWTMGCDEETGRFFFAYAKNMGVTDGKMYHRMAQASAGGLVVSSEVVAWTDVTWKVKTNQNSFEQSMDSEFINGKYYVVFQNTNNAGNYKATVIGTSTTNGTWTNALGTPHDIDSDFASALHGIGASIGCIGGKYAGVICSRRSTGSPYPNNTVLFKRLDTVTGSFGSLETIDLGQNNPSYDYDMTRFSSVSFLENTPFIMVQKSLSGGYGEDQPRTYKRQSNGVWVRVNTFADWGIDPTSFAYTGVLMTDGKRIYNTVQATDGGGSQLFNCPLMQYGANGFTCWYYLPSPLRPSYFPKNMFLSRYPSSNGFGVCSYTRGVQNGKGCQNAFGLIHSQGFQTTLKVNYFKTYSISPTISIADFTTDAGRRKFAGFNKLLINNGTYGSVQVSGLVDGFTNLVTGNKYYISESGLLPYKTDNSVYVGIAKSSTTIDLNIDNSENLSTPTNDPNSQYSAIPVVAGLEFQFDGELKFTPTGTNTQVGFKAVVAGDYLDVNGNPFSGAQYRRLQK